LFLSVISPLHASAEDYDLYIARGIQKINEGEMNDALEFLKKALELSPENPEATYYAGIAYSRLGSYKKAEELFFKTLQLDDTAIDVYLELGRLYYVTSRCDKAEEFLSKFTALSEDEELKKYAVGLVETCREEAEEKPYRLNIAVGSQYDSNVILEPSNPPVDAGRKSDTRALVYITSGATLLEKGMIKLKADYSFYQSLHLNLNDFNVHYHKITPALEIAISDVFKPSVGYSLEYTLLGSELYSRVHTYYGKI
jgi:tetratricopeptide (TPR) repeat protein